MDELKALRELKHHKDYEDSTLGKKKQRKSKLICSTSTSPLPFLFGVSSLSGFGLSLYSLPFGVIGIGGLPSVFFFPSIFMTHTHLLALTQHNNNSPTANRFVQR